MPWPKHARARKGPTKRQSRPWQGPKARRAGRVKRKAGKAEEGAPVEADARGDGPAPAGGCVLCLSIKSDQVWILISHHHALRGCGRVVGGACGGVWGVGGWFGGEGGLGRGGAFTQHNMLGSQHWHGQQAGLPRADALRREGGTLALPAHTQRHICRHKHGIAPPAEPWPAGPQPRQPRKPAHHAFPAHKHNEDADAAGAGDEDGARHAPARWVCRARSSCHEQCSPLHGKPK